MRKSRVPVLVIRILPKNQQVTEMPFNIFSQFLDGEVAGVRGETGVCARSLVAVDTRAGRVRACTRHSPPTITGIISAEAQATRENIATPATVLVS